MNFAKYKNSNDAAKNIQVSSALSRSKAGRNSKNRATSNDSKGKQQVGSALDSQNTN